METKAKQKTNIWKRINTWEKPTLQADAAHGAGLEAHRVVPAVLEALLWSRTNGVDTNGAAAEVMNFGSLGKKLRPATFWKIEVG